MTPLVASELDKLRSSGALALIVLVGLLAVAGSSALAAKDLDDRAPVSPRGANYELRTDRETSPATRAEVRRDALARWTVLGLIALIAGIVSVGGEFQNGTAAATFLATPRRARVLAAKALACALIFLPLSLGGAAINGAIVGFGASGSLELSTLELVELVSGGAFTVLVLLGAGIGLGALVPRPARAIILAVGVLALLEPALIPPLDDWGGASYLPSSTLAAVTQTDPATGVAARDLASPGAGAAGALFYAALLGVGGGLVLERRDVG